MRKIGAVWILAICAAAAGLGCSSPPTVVRVNAPVGSTMSVGGKKYDLPATVTLQRPRKAGEERREGVAFTFPVEGQQTIGAEGVLQMFGYDERDVDRLSANTCNIGEAELGQLLEGYALIFDGYTASKQHVFKMTIGKKK